MIKKIQERLALLGLDGWLLYDNHGSNRFIPKLFQMADHFMVTRRFFYWIPKEGEPVKIIHRIEADVLDAIPGEKKLYSSWKELELLLQNMVKNKKIAMEYSPRNALPAVSLVDAGTFELLRGFGVEIVSSDELLQYFTSVLTEEQIATHREAASVVDNAVGNAWEFIRESLKKERAITELDVQQFILQEFKANNCISSSNPVCSVNEHSALPHYMPVPATSKQIKRGDFILIDLWCKKNLPHGVYADITQVAVAGNQPTEKQSAIFAIVQRAQESAAQFIKERLASGKPVMGFEVDNVCRAIIIEAGYGRYFTHRTGHSIDTEVHGGGANLDNLETNDRRSLLPGTIVSIEPGIYLPSEFGIRLEINLLIDHERKCTITDGIERTLHCLG